MTATAVQQPDRIVPVVLPDGRRIVIRRLTAADAPALVAAVERADPSDLRRRFIGELVVVEGLTKIKDGALVNPKPITIQGNLPKAGA